MEKRTAVFKITGELLHMLLKLPADTVVTGFSYAVFFDQDAYAIRVESKEFPLVREGHAAAQCNPLYGSVDGQPVFLGWDRPPVPAAESPAPSILAALDESRRLAFECGAPRRPDVLPVPAPRDVDYDAAPGERAANFAAAVFGAAPFPADPQCPRGPGRAGPVAPPAARPNFDPADVFGLQE